MALVIEKEARRVEAAGLVHRGLGRVEFFDLTASALAGLEETLDDLAEEGRHRFSFHSPIVRPPSFPYSGVTCFFLNEDPDLRGRSFELLEGTLAAAAAFGADYVVSHLTYGPTDCRDEARAAALAEEACRQMARLSRAYGVPVHIEFAAYSAAFNSASRFVELVAPHPELGICIDVGHAALGAAARGRDPMADIATLAPLCLSMHLWNTKGAAHTAAHGHTPLHPSQRPEDGWFDVAGAVRLVTEFNRSVEIVFEYPVRRVTAEIRAGYEWIAGLVGRSLET